MKGDAAAMVFVLDAKISRLRERSSSSMSYVKRTWVAMVRPCRMGK